MGTDHYLDAGQPTVLLISTPCTSLKGFSALNRVITTKAGCTADEIAAWAARKQMDAQRHFVSEQSLGSDFYKLDEWRQIYDECGPAVAQVDQCMAGKVGRRTGLPVKKSSEFWASTEQLISGLRQFR